ncbi:MAG: hypothetical protein ACRDRP_22245 [Pseudonocardiaceae bacterium]
MYFHGSGRLAFQRGVAYVELGRHADAVALLSTALEGLPDCYERDRARYAAQLAAATGSALATRDLRRVHAALRTRRRRARTEQVRALADDLSCTR